MTASTSVAAVVALMLDFSHPGGRRGDGRAMSPATAGGTWVRSGSNLRITAGTLMLKGGS